MAALKFGWLNKVYKSLLYTDKMWVWRNVENKSQDWGYTDSLRPNIYDRNDAIFKNIDCRISPNTFKDTTKDSNQYNDPLDWQPEIFWQPDIILKAGDWVEVERGEIGTIYSGYIGEPQCYDSHNQTLMRRDSNA